MNLTLHWLRRDLRRYAPALALWVLLVAVFTWARIWLRTHPDFFIGDRDLWLSVPAAALGFAEVCLLLRILVDDPARGPHAFWKTRPPSGGAVFAAKATLCALAALVIPFAAEGVFLAAVGPSGGNPERISLYLLPPVLALMTGAVTMSWKAALVWLPVSIGVLTAGMAWHLWRILSGRLEFPADHRLIAVAVVLTAMSTAAFAYRRRCAGIVNILATLVAPLAVGLATAATGWPRDPRLHTPPTGMGAAAVQITWLQPPQVNLNRNDGQWSLTLLFHVNGLKVGAYADVILQNITLKGDGICISRGRLLDQERHVHGYSEGKPGAYFHILLSEEEAGALGIKPWTAIGTLRLRVFDRKPYSLALDRTHTIEAGDCRWVITPALSVAERDPKQYWGWRDNDNGIWCEFDYLNFAPLPHRHCTFIEPESIHLRRAAGNVSRRVMNLPFRPLSPVWEGIGRGIKWLDFATNEEAKELTDRTTWKHWTLDFNTVALVGTLKVPFTLHWPEAN